MVKKNVASEKKNFNKNVSNFWVYRNIFHGEITEEHSKKALKYSIRNWGLNGLQQNPLPFFSRAIKIVFSRYLKNEKWDSHD